MKNVDNCASNPSFFGTGDEQVTARTPRTGSGRWSSLILEVSASETRPTTTTVGAVSSGSVTVSSGGGMPRSLRRLLPRTTQGPSASAPVTLVFQAPLSVHVTPTAPTATLGIAPTLVPGGLWTTAQIPSASSPSALPVLSVAAPTHPPAHAGAQPVLVVTTTQPSTGVQPPQMLVMTNPGGGQPPSSYTVPTPVVSEGDNGFGAGCNGSSVGCFPPVRQLLLERPPRPHAPPPRVVTPMTSSISFQGNPTQQQPQSTSFQGNPTQQQPQSTSFQGNPTQQQPQSESMRSGVSTQASVSQSRRSPRLVESQELGRVHRMRRRSSPSCSDRPCSSPSPPSGLARIFMDVLLGSLERSLGLPSPSLGHPRRPGPGTSTSGATGAAGPPYGESSFRVSHASGTASSKVSGSSGSSSPLGAELDASEDVAGRSGEKAKLSKERTPSPTDCGSLCSSAYAGTPDSRATVSPRGEDSPVALRKRKIGRSWEEEEDGTGGSDSDGSSKIPAWSHKKFRRKSSRNDDEASPGGASDM
ncbi:UNVERIFIED_CONTAM: hypothetical protein HHA_294970 [Hammondia hammondi]|eukprot:XP_008886829.1 hypothetical protein HHA_294970 [Hammondia hammondi]